MFKITRARLMLSRQELLRVPSARAVPYWCSTFLYLSLSFCSLQRRHVWTDWGTRWELFIRVCPLTIKAHLPLQLLLWVGTWGSRLGLLLQAWPKACCGPNCAVPLTLIFTHILALSKLELFYPYENQTHSVWLCQCNHLVTLPITKELASILWKVRDGRFYTNSQMYPYTHIY